MKKNKNIEDDIHTEKEQELEEDTLKTEPLFATDLTLKYILKDTESFDF